MSATTSFEQIYNHLMTLPLWVKQVIYAVLKQDLERLLSPKTLATFTTDDTLQLWKPQLLSEGELHLNRAQKRYDTDVLKLLYHAQKGRNVMDITILNRWSLEHTCEVILEAWKSEFVDHAHSKIIWATVLFISNHIRIGEFLVQTDRITEAQLDQALRTQDYIDQSLDERTGLAEVMINLGYINRQDSESILFLKQESQKTFDGSNLASLAVQTPATSPEVEQLQQKLRQYHQRVQQLEGYIRQMQGQPKAKG